MGNETQLELIDMCAQHPGLHQKWSDLRKKQVRRVGAKRELRHQKVDVDFLTKKVEEKYVTVEGDAVWTPLQTYCNEVLPQNRFKTDVQRLRFVRSLTGVDLIMEEGDGDGDG